MQVTFYLVVWGFCLKKYRIKLKDKTIIANFSIFSIENIPSFPYHTMYFKIQISTQLCSPKYTFHNQHWKYVKHYIQNFPLASDFHQPRPRQLPFSFLPLRPRPEPPDQLPSWATHPPSASPCRVCTPQTLSTRTHPVASHHLSLLRCVGTVFAGNWK